MPGGTALIMKSSQYGRVFKRVPDRMGRFSYMLMNGKDNTVIPVLVLYRVCQRKGTTTTPNTSYMRECNAICLQGHKDLDPRAQLLKDIGKLLSKWTEKGHHPLIM